MCNVGLGLLHVPRAALNRVEQHVTKASLLALPTFYQGTKDDIVADEKRLPCHKESSQRSRPTVPLQAPPGTSPGHRRGAKAGS